MDNKTSQKPKLPNGHFDFFVNCSVKIKISKSQNKKLNVYYNCSAVFQ